MTTFRDMLTADTQEVFLNTDDFAIDATYTSADGTIIDKAIKVLSQPESKLNPTDYGASATEMFTVSKTDVPDPVIYDKIAMDGTTYTVRSRITGNHYMWRLICDTDQRQGPK